MKEDNIKQFFTSHKQAVPDDGFGARLLNTLDVLPQPQPAKDRKPLIIGVFTSMGLLLFVLLGGYGVLLNGMENMGLVYTDKQAITPQIITTLVMLILAFVALIRFALHAFER